MFRHSFGSGRAFVAGGPSSGGARQGLVTHQTVRLDPGRHGSPEKGACVMELASMLAGEPFSDHPESVCPVIGSFLRTYNDAIDDRRRQDLYAYASRVVGSHAPEEVQRARAERLAQWALERQPRWRKRLRRLAPCRQPDRARGLEATGVQAARAIRRHTERSHAEALAVIDELLAIGRKGACTAPAPEWQLASIILIRARHTTT